MLQYLLKLTISLSIVYLFYQLLLRRLTFYNWNRWYLLIYSLVCFIIPFINVFTFIVGRPALRELAIVNYIPAITQITPDNTTVSVGINWWLVTGVVFIIGILVMAARLGMQYYSLYRMRSKAVLLYDNKVKLYHIDEPVMPFSYGRGIYVNQHQHSEHELKEIIRHEFIHVKQRHSLDIIWSELLCILNWYNPFAWLLRHDIRQNLEFLADQQVLQTGLDRKQYQYLLLKVIGVNSFSIANNFNFSSLKKRIAMMNKAQSARVHLIRFLFLLPLLVVVLLAFRNTNQIHRQALRTLVTDTIPTAEKMPPGWKEMESIDVNNSKVTVRLKNKKVETYDLSNNREREVFEKKYGPLPTPPPPPPVPAIKADIEVKEAPEAPEKAELPEAPEKPEAPEAPTKLALTVAPKAPQVLALTPVPPPPPPKDPELANLTPVPPLPPPPPPVPAQDCYNPKGFCITVVDNHGEPIVIVKDKDNKIVLAVSLSDWNKDKQQNENKYGEVPSHQVILLKKAAMGYNRDHVSVKPATVVKDDQVTEVVVKNSPKMMEGQIKKVVTTPSNGYLLMVNGRPVHAGKPAASTASVTDAKEVTEVKIIPVEGYYLRSQDGNTVVRGSYQSKLAAEAKATVAAKVKVEAEAKEAASVKIKAETKAREAAEPKPATPSKEQE